MEKNKDNNISASLLALYVVCVTAIFFCIIGTSLGLVASSYFEDNNEALREQYYRGIYDTCIQTDLTITQCRSLVREISQEIDPYEKASIEWNWPIE